MEYYPYPLRTKRKELEDVSDEFSDFSFSSPATKIRRLDAELPPIIEEVEADTPMMMLSQSEPLVENGYVGQGGGGGRGCSVMIEELESAPSLNEVNEERALVLFKPIDTSLLQSPSPYSYSVSSNFIAGIKNQVFLSNQSNLLSKAADSETEKGDEESKECKAVVPWVPPTHLQPVSIQEVGAAFPQSDTLCEMMDADEMGVASMDVEEENSFGADQRQPESGYQVNNINEGLNMWTQGPQHCMIPQPPQNFSAPPVTWFR